MKIFLDDIRSIDPELQYATVRTYAQCVLLLGIFKDNISAISLDYDLGPDINTGYNVLVYMHENGIEPKFINIHSTHKEGVIKMESYLRENFKNSSHTRNRV